MVNTTLLNDTEISTNETEHQITAFAVACILILTATALLLNSLSLIVLKKNATLRKKTFYRYTLLLSTSDLICSLAGLITFLCTILQLQHFEISYICFVSNMFIVAALATSLVQILLICVERLIATFVCYRYQGFNGILRVLYVGLTLSSLVYIITIYGIYGDGKSTSCQLRNIFGTHYWKFQLGVAYFRITLLSCIVCVYVVVILRVKRQFRKIQPHTTLFRYRQPCGTHKNQPSVSYIKTDLSKAENQTTTSSSSTCQDISLSDSLGELRRLKRFRKTVFILTAIICVMLMTFLPALILNCIAGSVDKVVSSKVLEFSNLLALLSPLMDPLIYVFTIKEFRLSCKRHSTNSTIL